MRLRQKWHERERKDLAPVEGLFCRSLQNSVFGCFVAFEPKDVNSAVVQRNVIAPAAIHDQNCRHLARSFIPTV